MREGHTRTLSKWITVFAFALISVASLFVFGVYVFRASGGLLRMEEIVEFNKGAMYMLGIGATSSLLVVFMIHELTGKKITPSYNKKATRVGLVFLGLIFVVPQVADYFFQEAANGRGYVFCEDHSYRWLHAQNKVFAVSAPACESGREGG